MELTIISTSERRNHHVLKIFPGFCQNEYAQRAVNLPVVRSYSYPFSLRMSSMNIKNCYSCFRSSNYGWTWPICIPPVPNNKSALNIRTQIGPKGPYLPFLFFLWFWNQTTIVLARTTQNCPGRMNTSHEQETSIIYLRHVCTHSVSEKEAGSHGRWFATPHQAITISHQRHGPCGEALPTRGCGEGQRSHVVEGWQGADATSLTRRCGVRCRLLKHADTGALCAVLFCCERTW